MNRSIPILLFGTKVTSAVASSQTEEGTRSFSALRTVRPAPYTWPFVQRGRPIISLGEQDTPDATHIHDRVNEDVERIYGTALMVSESLGVEIKLHDNGKQVTVLLDSGPSGNDLDDQLILGIKHRMLDLSTVYWTSSIPLCVARFIWPEGIN